MIALAVPPARTGVGICPRPRSHLQAMGTDAAGRRTGLLPPGVPRPTGRGRARSRPRRRPRAARAAAPGRGGPRAARCVCRPRLPPDRRPPTSGPTARAGSPRCCTGR
ncbi:hypothetical protein ABT093_28785 [Kitasatospora sp. NPDC002551]|uniref:hypothetical protein n=1 Tax=Kitasatospora sp. NPDC002551 TaxID=3154539 RepID=UPI003329F018